MRVRISGLMADGQVHYIDCDDLDEAYDRLLFMLCHNNKWAEIHVYAGDTFKVVYRDPAIVIEEIRAMEEER